MSQRALWVDAGNAADFDKSIEFDITSHYYALTDPVEALHPRLLDSRNQGYGTGVYMASNWDEFSGMSGGEAARFVHEAIKFIKYPNPTWPRVQFDIELHDPKWIEDCFETWRQLRPYQSTSWTLESFQGGWMTPDFVAGIHRCRIRVVPQFYIGRMAQIELRSTDPATFYKQLVQEQVAQDAALRDLTARGFPESVVTGFFDAACLPLRGLDGFIFTQGRLP
jgi:hypothetical protein